jgi:hypothetical protein
VRRRVFDTLAGILMLFAIAVGVVWSSRLLPRQWWIEASIPLAEYFSSILTNQHWLQLSFL